MIMTNIAEEYELNFAIYQLSIERTYLQLEKFLPK